MSQTKSNFRTIPIFVNVEKAAIVDENLPAEPVTVMSQLPAVFCGETVIFCFHLIDSAGNPVPVEQNDSFELSIDVDFLHDNDPLMAYSGTDNVNLEGDWNEAIAEEGQFSMRVSCHTGSFLEKIGTRESVPVWLELRRYHDSGAMSELLRYQIKAKNVIHWNEDEPEEGNVTYYTAAQIDSIIADLQKNLIQS